MKDLGFAATLAQATGTRTVLLPVLKAAFEELTEQAYGDHDIAVTRRYMAQARPAEIHLSQSRDMAAARKSFGVDVCSRRRHQLSDPYASPRTRSQRYLP